MTRPSPTLDIEEVTITPKMAEQLLTRNFSNRKLRPTVIARYAHDMAQGKWRLKGQTPILLDKSGNLVNGQHRLFAAIQSGSSFPAYLIHGADPEDVVVTDSGLTRTLSDVLAWKGTATRPNWLAGLVRIGYLYDNNKITFIHFGASPSRTEALEWLEAHPGAEESLEAVKDIFFRLRMPVGALALVHYYGMKRFPEKTERFFYQLRHGTELHEGDPVLALRRRMGERLLPSGTIRILYVLAILIKAFNAYIEDRPIGRVRWNYRGKRAEPFPRLLGE